MIKTVVFIFLISLDLFTKFLIQNNLFINQSIKINVFFDLVYVQNFGVSFGLFSESVPYWLFIIIGLLIVLIIYYLMEVSRNLLEKYAYFIIITGAMGNIIDRSLNTFVVDFISIHYENFYWPAFNLADIYITIGILMLLFSILTKSKDY